MNFNYDRDVSQREHHMLKKRRQAFLGAYLKHRTKGKSPSESLRLTKKRYSFAPRY